MDLENAPDLGLNSQPSEQAFSPRAEPSFLQDRAKAVGLKRGESKRESDLQFQTGSGSPSAGSTPAAFGRSTSKRGGELDAPAAFGRSVSKKGADLDFNSASNPL